MPLMLFAAISALATQPNTPEPEQTTPAPILLTNFEKDQPTLNWFVVNDNVMGGRSEGGPTFHETHLTFSGFTNTNGGGFSSIRAPITPDQLDQADAITLRVKGDDRTYRLGFRTTNRYRREYTNYQATFQAPSENDWTNVTVPFSAFKASWRGRNIQGQVPPFDPTRAAQLTLTINDEIHGPFELHIDQIAATQTPATPTDQQQQTRLDALLSKLN